jgi:hypothetical protein
MKNGIGVAAGRMVGKVKAETLEDRNPGGEFNGPGLHIGAQHYFDWRPPTGSATIMSSALA